MSAENVGKLIGYGIGLAVLSSPVTVPLGLAFLSVAIPAAFVAATAATASIAVAVTGITVVGTGITVGGTAAAASAILGASVLLKLSEKKMTKKERGLLDTALNRIQENPTHFSMNENELVALDKLKLLIEKNNNHRTTKKYAGKYTPLLERIAISPAAAANSYTKATDKLASSPPASLRSSFEYSDSSEKSSSSEADSELSISTKKKDASVPQDNTESWLVSRKT